MKTWRWNAILAEGIGTFMFFFVGIGAGALGGTIGVVGIALARLKHQGSVPVVGA